MTEYKIGDEVRVKMPDGYQVGRVVSVIHNYGWSGETKYTVHGKEFATIASARIMQKVEA